MKRRMSLWLAAGAVLLLLADGRSTAQSFLPPVPAQPLSPVQPLISLQPQISSQPVSPPPPLISLQPLGPPQPLGSYQPPGTPPLPCYTDAPVRPFTPVMLGDFLGPLASVFWDLKIAEGQSPRPMDRVYYNFNAFWNVNKDQWHDITQPISHVNLYRSVFGLEKTFMDGQVSVGLRIPFYTLNVETHDVFVQQTPDGPILAPGGPGADSTHFGNISAIVKMIVWEDKQTGSLVSGGATLTLPTASSRLIDPGPSELAYVEPFGGFIVQRGDFFVHGFVSVIFPIARPESIMLFTDLGAGYWVYRNGSHSQLITGVAPTVEIHIADPLRTADPAVNVFGVFDNIRPHNVVDFTFGGTFELWGRATVGLGLVVPVTGPKPFDVEAIAQVNWRF
jgi:hypothetical protein